MIEVKEAALKAREYLSSVLGLGITGITLEEIELDEGNGYWLITLGYFAQEGPFPGIYGIPKKNYKVFKVRASDGQVISMKIRDTNE